MNLAEVWRHLEGDTRITDAPWKSATTHTASRKKELLPGLGDSPLGIECSYSVLELNSVRWTAGRTRFPWFECSDVVRMGGREAE